MSGHGWVTPNADGSVARCGGPAICAQCAGEQVAAYIANARAARLRDEGMRDEARLIERQRIVKLVRERAARRKANGDVMGQINVGPMREEQGEWFASARALNDLADELERGE